MKLFKKALITTIALLVIISISFAAGYEICKINISKSVEANNLFNGFDLKLPGEVEKYTITINDVKSKLKEIGEFSSHEGIYDITIGKDYTRYMLDNIPVPFTKNHVELICKGIVKVGYKTSDICVRIDDISNTIYIVLPKICVTSNEITEINSNEKNNILNPIEFSQYTELLDEVKKKGLDDAKSNGLFRDAKNSAKKQISEFLSDFSNYKVVFI